MRCVRKSAGVHWRNKSNPYNMYCARHRQRNMHIPARKLGNIWYMQTANTRE